MTAKLSLWILPRLRDVLFLAIFVSALALGYRMLNMDGDLPHHFLMGRYVVQTGHPPMAEQFLYPTAGQPFVDDEWGAELILYVVYSVAGLAGVVLLSATLLASSFALLYSALSTRLQLSLPVLALVIWGAAVSSLHWIARPHLFSMLLLVVCLLWTDRLARGEKIAFWQLPLLFVIWANMHGEFIVGILVLFAFAAGWTWDYLFKGRQAPPANGWKIWPALLLSLLATLVNPTGVGPWKTVFGFLGNHYMMTRMAETNAPNFQDPGFYVVLGLLAFSIFLLAVKRERISTAHAFLLTGFTVMVLTTIRNVHLYGLVAPFVLAGALPGIDELHILARLEDALQRVQAELRGVVWPVLITLVASLLVLTSTAARQYYRFDPGFFPVGAVDWLAGHPQQGNMFNDLDWGGYIDLRLWPKQSAFLDSVSDMSGGMTEKYEKVVTLSDGWQSILAGYNVRWVILPSKSPLALRLAADPGWESLYSDPTAAILRMK